MVQYGNYKNAKSIIAHSGQPVETMSAGVIYLSGLGFWYLRSEVTRKQTEVDQR